MYILLIFDILSHLLYRMTKKICNNIYCLSHFVLHTLKLMNNAVKIYHQHDQVFIPKYFNVVLYIRSSIFVCRCFSTCAFRNSYLNFWIFYKFKLVICLILRNSRFCEFALKSLIFLGKIAFLQLDALS